MFLILETHTHTHAHTHRHIDAHRQMMFKCLKKANTTEDIYIILSFIGRSKKISLCDV